MISSVNDYFIVWLIFQGKKMSLYELRAHDYKFTNVMISLKLWNILGSPRGLIPESLRNS